MSAELPFEYSQRRSYLLRQAILAKTPAELDAALRAVEEGDRELEEYLANLDPGTGGGTTSGSVFGLSDNNTYTLGAGVTATTWSFNVTPPAGATQLFFIAYATIYCLTDTVDAWYYYNFQVDGVNAGVTTEIAIADVAAGVNTMVNSLNIDSVTPGVPINIKQQFTTSASQGLKQTNAHMNGIWMVS